MNNATSYSAFLNPNKLFGYIYWILAIALIAYIYSPSLLNEFVWDDSVFLGTHAFYNDPAYIRTAFSEPFFISANYYRPLAIISLYGEARNSGVDSVQMHLTNLLLHLFSVTLVILIAYVIERKYLNSTNKLIPAVCGLIYGLHPALLESIAWISGRFDLLLTTLVLTMMFADLIINNKIIRALLVGLLFFTAALTKEMIVAYAMALPFIHMALKHKSILKPGEYVKNSIKDGDIFVYVSIFIAGLAYIALRYYNLGYLTISETSNFNADRGNLIQQILLVFKSLGLYLTHIVYPFYDISPVHPDVFPLKLTDPVALISLTAILAAFIAFLVLRKPARLWFFLLAIPMLLLPVIHILTLVIGGNIIHGRFLTMPLAVICACMLPFLGHYLARSTVYFRSFSIAIVSLWLAVSIVNLNITIPLWGNNNALWTWAYTKHPDSLDARYNYLSALLDKEEYDEVIHQAKLAYEDHANSTPLIILSQAYMSQGKLELAEQTILDTLEKHSLSKLHYSSALTSLGYIQMCLKRYEDVDMLLDNSLSIYPRYSRPYFLKAAYAVEQGDMTNARAYVDLAITYSDGETSAMYTRLFNIMLDTGEVPYDQICASEKPAHS